MSASYGQVEAVILAAGQGSRMGAARNKVWLTLAGRPLLVYAAEALAATPGVTHLLAVAHPQEVALCQEILATQARLPLPFTVIPGGASRHQSEQCALDHLRVAILAGEIDLVLIHDGARPLITPDDVQRLIAAAHTWGGALLALPVPAGERIVRADAAQHIVADLPGDALWRAQTPQAFAAMRLLAAYDAAEQDGFEGTDTAASFARTGGQVAVVAGSAANIKVTTPDDLVLAEHLLRQRTQAHS
jgi:2-C-methyl-D-erythritol 4-phosphate cytidylyltransferase